MKKIIGIRVFLVSLGLLLVSGFASAEPSSTLEKLRTTKVLTIGVRDSAAPFATYKDGVAEGYSVDICNEVAAGLEQQLKQKITVKYVPVSAANRIDLLRSGAIDLECGSTTDTAEREQLVSFTYPIFVTGARLAVAKDSHITDYKNLANAHVVVVAGSSCEKLIVPALVTAQAHGQGFTVSTVKGNNEGVLAVSARRADAFCTDDVLLAAAIMDNQLNDKLHRVSQPLSVEPYSLMVRKDDRDFLKAVDDIVAQFLVSGRAAKLGSKWFDTPALRYKFNSMTMDAFAYPTKTKAY